MSHCTFYLVLWAALTSVKELNINLLPGLCSQHEPWCGEWDKVESWRSEYSLSLSDVRDVAVLKETNSSSSIQVWSALFLSGAGTGDDPDAQIDIKAGRSALSPQGLFTI